MKRNIIFLALIFVFIKNYGADSFSPMHKVELPLAPTVIVQQHTDDFKFFLNSTEKDMVMVDGIAGKILWQISIVELTGNKKTENQFWNQNANVILIYNEDSKKGIATKYFIDGSTGKLLWKSDKYPSEYGKFNLSANYQNDYDPSTNGVLLPNKETIDFVNVSNGTVIWSKPFSIEGKEKHFNCFIMNNYDLVRVITGEESEFYLTITQGKDVSNAEDYYNRKKAFENNKNSTVVSIPEKNMYVVMKTKNSTMLSLLGTGGLASWKMDFMAFKEDTHELIWSQNYLAAHSYDYISLKSFVKMVYLDGKIFIEHMPNVKSNSGLTVLDVNTGNKLWECYYTTLEDKGGPNNKVYTPFPAPDPIALNGNIYVVDKIKNKMYCYSSDAGQLKWETEKFPDAQKIPTLIGYDDVVIIGYGGPEKKMSCIIEDAPSFVWEYRNKYKAVYKSGKKKFTYKYIYNDEDKYGLTAYNSNTGEVVWSHETIAKSLKDKFSYIAGTMLYNNNLYVATDKNLFVLNPKTGEMVSSYAIKEEKVGDIWKFQHFPEKNEVILNCTDGIVKIDLKQQKKAGTIKVSNVQGPVLSEFINADDAYTDYAIFTEGNVKKMEYKNFASIDLEKMKVRGTGTADVIFSDMTQFSQGAEYFFKSDGKVLEIFRVK